MNDFKKGMLLVVGIFAAAIIVIFALSEAGRNTATTNADGSQQTDTTSASKVEVTDIGHNVWEGKQLTLGQKVGDNELYVAHGDVKGNGGCNVMVFVPGEVVSALSKGSWTLVIIKGGDGAARGYEVLAIAKKAASGSKDGNCPIDGYSAPDTSAGKADTNKSGGNVPSGSGEDLKVTDFGLNIWAGKQLTIPTAPAGPNEVYMAHGDVLENGGCNVMTWGPGETVKKPSNATWRLLLISGGTQVERDMEVAKRQKQAAGNSDCPFVD